jgi:hypothetical protein
VRFLRKKWLVLISALAILSSVFIYFQQRYFFNPLTFRKNNVLYLPFKWYKKPLQIQVAEIKLNSSSRAKGYTTFDPHEIRFVVRELEKGKVVKRPTYSDTETAVLHIWLRSGSKSDSPILQDVYIQMPSYSNVGQIYTENSHHAFDEYIILTPALQSWISKSLKKGKPIQ